MPRKSPCDGCVNEKLSKSSPVIWMVSREKLSDSINRSAVYEPGKNILNPCWMCSDRFAYDDYLRSEFTGPPSSWPDGVYEYSIDMLQEL